MIVKVFVQEIPIQLCMLIECSMKVKIRVCKVIHKHFHMLKGIYHVCSQKHVIYDIWMFLMFSWDSENLLSYEHALKSVCSKSGAHMNEWINGYKDGTSSKYWMLLANVSSIWSLGSIFMFQLSMIKWPKTLNLLKKRKCFPTCCVFHALHCSMIIEMS